MASAPAEKSATTPHELTLLTLPLEIRMMIWKFSQRSAKELELTDCGLIQQRGICENECYNHHKCRLSSGQSLSLHLCPLLLVNQQTRSETLKLGKARGTLHLCLFGWFRNFLDDLNFAQRSLVNRARVTFTFEKNDEFEAEKHLIAERWRTHLKSKLGLYFERVELVDWAYTAKTHPNPQLGSFITIPPLQVFHVEVRVEKARDEVLLRSRSEDEGA